MADAAQPNRVQYISNEKNRLQYVDGVASVLLDEVVQYLNENERKGVLLTGYSDNQGTAAYIKGLARQRATEVKKALMMRGIDVNRIEIDVKGDEDPIGDNSTYEGRVQNNRVSIKIQ